MPFNHQILQSPAAIAIELPQWNSMVARFYQGFPQLSAEWTQEWLAHFASANCQIRVVKITEGNNTVGYFPLIERQESFHHLKLNYLTFSSNLYSPVSVPIVDLQQADPILTYFAKNVLPGLRWDVFFWERLPEEVLPLEKLESTFGSTGYPVGRGKVEGNWIYQHGAQTSAEYLASRKSSFRKNSRRMENRLEELGQVDFRIFINSDSSNGMDDYESVYSRSWKPTEEDPAFFRDVVARLGCVEQTRLGVLYLNEQPISTQLWYFAQKRGYMVKTAYDEAFKAHSPGTLVIRRMVEYLIDQDGMTSFDCLRGDEDYNQNWADERRERHNLYIFRGDMKGRLLHALDQKILPATRKSPILKRLKRMLGK